MTNQSKTSWTIRTRSGAHRSPALDCLNGHSIDLGVMVNNVGALPGAKNPRPYILTTIGAKAASSSDPLSTEITEIFPDVTPIDRTSTCLVAPGVPGRGSTRRVARSDHGRLVTEVCLDNRCLPP